MRSVFPWLNKFQLDEVRAGLGTRLVGNVCLTSVDQYYYLALVALDAPHVHDAIIIACKVLILKYFANFTMKADSMRLFM